MSTNERIRGAVLDHLREHGEPVTISSMADEIRRQRTDLSSVPDFDFRSTVLRMMAVGDVESTSTNRVVVAVHQSSAAARG